MARKPIKMSEFFRMDAWEDNCERGCDGSLRLYISIAKVSGDPAITSCEGIVDALNALWDCLEYRA